MPKTLLIRRKDDAAQFEDYLSDPQTYKCRLKIPNSLTGAGSLGTSVAYCQFLLTWARNTESRVISTFLDSTSKNQLNKFVSRVDGLLAAYISEQLLSEETESKDVIDLRHKALKSASDRIKAMAENNLSEMGKGQEAELIFVQHAKNEFHNAFYRTLPNVACLRDGQKHKELIREPSELLHFLERIFKHFKVYKEPFTNPQNATLHKNKKLLAELLYELFCNTAEHAYFDSEKKKLKHNLRCIRIASPEVTPEALANKTIVSSKAKDSAVEYFKNLTKKNESTLRKHIRMLEISIFDSGSGMARTMSPHKKLNDTTALESVIKCFEKGASSKNAPNAGMGLHRALGLLDDLGGFARFRTANTEAFYGAGYKHTKDTNPSEYVHGGLAYVEGTAITICIPLMY